MGRAFLFLYLLTQFTISLHQMVKLDLSEFFLIVFLIAFFLRALNTNEKIITTKLDAFNLLFAISILFATTNTTVFVFVLSSITLIKFLIIPFLVVNLVYKENLLEFAVRWIIIFSTISAVFAIIQELVFLTTGTLLFVIPDQHWLKFLFEYTSFGTFLRVPALFDKYRIFNCYLLISMAFVFNLLLYKTDMRLKLKILYVFSFILMLVALLLTFSKDSILSLVLVVFLSTIVRHPFLIIHGSVAILAFFLALHFFGLMDDLANFFSTMVTIDEPHVRLQLAREGLQGFMRHPWLGVGPGLGFRYTCHYFQWPAHNSFIQAADELGIFGLLAFSLLMGYVLFILIRVNLLVKNDFVGIALLRGLLFAFVSYFIGIQFHPMYIDKTNWLLMGMAQSAVLATNYKPNITFESK